MDYFGKIVSGEAYLSDDWNWRQKLLKQRRDIQEETRIPQRTYGRLASTTLEPLDLAYRTPLPSTVVAADPPAFCGNCCRKMTTYSSGLSTMADDVTFRALPDLSDVTHYPMAASFYAAHLPARFDYLTSRRYPYNKTMTELVDDIRHEQQMDKLMSESKGASSNYWPEPRVVETSYYDPLPTPTLTKANSMENIFVPQERLRKWEAPESVYEKIPSWHAKKRNEDFPLRGSYQTSYTPYAPYKHIHNEYPTYRRECRPMSRYVYEVQPYHSVRELEMDRIMKAKSQQKFFAKREKKPEETAFAKKPETRSCKLDELSVPESEPFRRAFAVNGFKNENGEKEPTIEKPVSRVNLLQVEPSQELESQIEVEADKVVEEEVAEEEEVVEEVVADKLEEVEEVVPEPVRVTRKYEAAPAPVTKQVEIPPEPEAPIHSEVQEPEVPKIKTEQHVPDQTEVLVQPEVVEQVAEPVPEVSEPVPDNSPVLEIPEPEVEPPVIIVSQNVEPVAVVEDPAREGNEPEQVIEQAPDTVEEEKNESIPENQPDEEVVENQASDETEEQPEAEAIDAEEAAAVKELIEDVLDVASAVTAVAATTDESETNGNADEAEEQTDEAGESGNPEVEKMDNNEDEDEEVKTITVVKTGHILIEETDLGNDECIRTEYEIEEVEISH